MPNRTDLKTDCFLPLTTLLCEFILLCEIAYFKLMFETSRIPVLNYRKRGLLPLIRQVAQCN